MELYLMVKERKWRQNWLALLYLTVVTGSNLYRLTGDSLSGNRTHQYDERADGPSREGGRGEV